MPNGGYFVVFAVLVIALVVQSIRLDSAGYTIRHLERVLDEMTEGSEMERKSYRERIAAAQKALRGES